MKKEIKKAMMSGMKDAKDSIMGQNKAHPGFKAVQAQIAKKGGYSKDQAGAILASKSRKASPAAKKANPKLKKVKGSMKKMKK